MPGDRNPDDCVFDEASGEWQPESDGVVTGNLDTVAVRDAVSSSLADGDNVALIRNLAVKGAGQILKRSTVIKSIRLTGDTQVIDCRYDAIRGRVLRAEFVRKR